MFRGRMSEVDNIFCGRCRKSSVWNACRCANRGTAELQRTKIGADPRSKTAREAAVAFVHCIGLDVASRGADAAADYADGARPDRCDRPAPERCRCAYRSVMRWPTLTSFTWGCCDLQLGAQLTESRYARDSRRWPPADPPAPRST